MTASQPDTGDAKPRRRSGRFSQFCYSIRDLVFPLPSPLTPDERAAADRSVNQIVEFAKTRIGELAAEPFERGTPPDRGTRFVGIAQKQLEEQQSRIVHVENRVATILGLASLAGTVAFTAMPGFLEAATRLPPRAQFALRFAVGYSLLQLVAIIVAGVRGHERQPRNAVTLGHLLPALGETEWASTNRILEVLRAGAAELEVIGSRKVTWLACAHRAARQLAVALIFIAAVWIVLYPTASASPSSRIPATREKSESTSRSGSPLLPPVAGPRPLVPKASDSARLPSGRK